MPPGTPSGTALGQGPQGTCGPVTGYYGGRVGRRGDDCRTGAQLCGELADFFMPLQVNVLPQGACTGGSKRDRAVSGVVPRVAGPVTRMTGPVLLSPRLRTHPCPVDGTDPAAPSRPRGGSGPCSTTGRRSGCVAPPASRCRWGGGCSGPLQGGEHQEFCQDLIEPTVPSVNMGRASARRQRRAPVVRPGCSTTATTTARSRVTSAVSTTSPTPGLHGLPPIRRQDG